MMGKNDAERDDAQRAARLHEIELAVSYALRAGVTVSFVVIAIGSIALFISGQAFHSHFGGEPVPQTPEDVIARLARLDPSAIIDLGLMLLILTPVFRVLVGVIAFLVEGDVTFAIISAIVLCVLLASFVLGRVE